MRVDMIMNMMETIMWTFVWTLDLGSNSEEDILEHGIYLELLCDKELDNSVLYPPKGKPYGCRRQQIHLSKTVSRKYLMKWES